MGEGAANRAIPAAIIVGLCTIVGAVIMATPSLLDRLPDGSPAAGQNSARYAVPDSAPSPRADGTERGDREERHPLDATSTDRTMDGGTSEAIDRMDGGTDRPPDQPSGGVAENPTSNPASGSRAAASTLTRTVLDGETTTLDDFGVTLSAEFKETAGISHVDVIFTPVGGSTRRLAGLAAGTEHEVRVGSRDFRLVVGAIDWQRRTVDVTLNPVES